MRAVAGLLTIHNSSMARRAARMPTKHIKIGLDLRIASEVISDINGLKLFPIYSCGTKMPFKEKVVEFVNLLVPPKKKRSHRFTNSQI